MRVPVNPDMPDSQDKFTLSKISRNMKLLQTTITAAILGIAVSSLAIAQEPQLDRTIPEKSEAMMKEEMIKKDHIMMKDGKMMVMKDGKSMAMEEDMKLESGTMVMKDGTFKNKDGKMMMMSNGDMMAMDGEMMMGDRIMMKDGKMMVMKGDKMMMMEEDMELSDGTKVMKDGKVMMKDGEAAMMEDGDMVSMGGVMRKAPMEKPAKNQPQDRN